MFRAKAIPLYRWKWSLAQELFYMAPIFCITDSCAIKVTCYSGAKTQQKASSCQRKAMWFQNFQTSSFFDLRVNTSTWGATSSLRIQVRICAIKKEPYNVGFTDWHQLSVVHHLLSPANGPRHTSLLACKRFDLNLMTCCVSLSRKNTQMVKGWVVVGEVGAGGRNYFINNSK